MINEKYLKEFIDKEIKKYLNDKGEVAKDLNGNLEKQDSFNETYLISKFTEHYDTFNKEIKIKSLSVNFKKVERDIESNEILSGILLLHELANY